VDQIRGDRPRDLQLKGEARVVDARPIDRRDQTSVVKMQTEVQEHHDRWALLSDVTNQERRGYVRRLTKAPIFNFTMGVWEMRVVRIKQPRPAWMQIAVPAALICIPLAAFVGAIWWFVLSLSTVSLIGLCAIALIMLIGLVTVTSRHGTITIEQIQKVTIRR
jgi:hypothetical protein